MSTLTIKDHKSLFVELKNKLWALLSVTALLFLLSGPAMAEAERWPTKPIRLVVAFPAGGFGDIIARSVQNQLSQALSVPVVIENRGGAGGNVAAAEVVRSKDGHTFLLTASTTESVNPLIYKEMPFDPKTDLQHVAVMALLQSFIFARPDFPAETFSEFVAEAKKMQNLNYGSAGTGTALHLAGEIMNRTVGLKAVHAPYRGAALALQDLASGQIDFAFGPATAMSLVDAGMLKLYGVASKQRSTSYPNVPTLQELGYPELEVDSYFVLYAPSSMPIHAVDAMNSALNEILSTSETKSRHAELGAVAFPVSIEESKRLVLEETEAFSQVLQNANIKID